MTTNVNFFYRYVNEHVLNELAISDYGYERCSEKKPPVGPSIKKTYSIHLVLKGEGTLEVNGKAFKIEKGSLFYVPIGIETVYYQDKNQPWHYIWVSFFGSKAPRIVELMELNENKPFFHTSNFDLLFQYFMNIINIPKDEPYVDILTLSSFLSIIQLISKERTEQTRLIQETKNEHLVNYIINYIEKNYNNNEVLDLNTISQQLNMNPIYLNRIFKKVVNMTIHQYIIIYRMQKACALFDQKKYTISEVSNMVGFSDPLYFSRLFKRYKGSSPKNYFSTGEA